MGDIVTHQGNPLPQVPIDPALLAQVFEEIYPAQVRRVQRSSQFSQEQAEDIVQQAFVNLLRWHPRNHPNPYQLRSVTVRAVRNAMIDEVRRLRRRPETVNIIDDPLVAADHLDILADPSVSVENAALADAEAPVISLTAALKVYRELREDWLERGKLIDELPAPCFHALINAGIIEQDPTATCLLYRVNPILVELYKGETVQPIADNTQDTQAAADLQERIQDREKITAMLDGMSEILSDLYEVNMPERITTPLACRILEGRTLMDAYGVTHDMLTDYTARCAELSLWIEAEIAPIKQERLAAKAQAEEAQA